MPTRPTRRPSLIAWTALLALAPAAAFAAPVDDDFADGVRGPQWSAVVDDPTHFSLAETGGVLNVVSAGGGSPNDDAVYLSNFRLSTAADFSARIDYAVRAPAGNGSFGDALALDFGVGRDLDGTDSAAIGAGYLNSFGLAIPGTTVISRTDDVQTVDATEVPSFLTGTFQVDYVAATDRLTLSRVSGGVGQPFSYSLPDGTVRGVWGATDGLLVSFGGRGDGFTFNAGDMTLDNFRVVSGSIVPEPASAVAFLGMAALLVRRRKTGWA